MKSIIFKFILFSTFSNAFSQSKGDFKFLAKPDSIIEKREDGYIYITSDTTSKVYDWIVPNPDDASVKEIYADYITEVRTKFNQPVKQFAIGSFPRKWNQVYVYKNNYFLYGSSDWMSSTGFYVSDSVIYITSSDPADIYVIRDFNSKGKESAAFTVMNYTGETKKISIKVIDSILGIYEWLIRDKTNNQEKFLMQNSAFSKKLKMIVCDCGDEKCLMEFKFDNAK